MQLPSILLLSSLPLLLAFPSYSSHSHSSLSTSYKHHSFTTTHHKHPTSPGTPTSTSSSSSTGASSSPSPASYCPPRPATPAQQRAIFASFVTLLYTARTPTAAFLAHVAPDLIEHDPFDEQGRDANAARLENIIPHANFTVLRSSTDNNIGFIHLRVEESPQPVALADIYRLNGTCIVEHWDIAQPRPANATNPIAMF